jgi:hypothetical protein
MREYSSDTRGAAHVWRGLCSPGGGIVLDMSGLTRKVEMDFDNLQWYGTGDSSGNTIRPWNHTVFSSLRTPEVLQCALWEVSSPIMVVECAL